MLRRRSANVVIVVTLVILVILFIVTVGAGSARPKHTHCKQSRTEHISLRPAGTSPTLGEDY